MIPETSMLSQNEFLSAYGPLTFKTFQTILNSLNSSSTDMTFFCAMEEIAFKEGFQAEINPRDKPSKSREKKDQFFNHGSITNRTFSPVVIIFCNRTISGLWALKSLLRANVFLGGQTPLHLMIELSFLNPREAFFGSQDPLNGILST